MTEETRNLGELFLEARRKYPTERQRGQRKPRKKNNTGISRLSIADCEDCKQGFTWRYAQQVNKKKHTFQSVDLLKLKKKVKDANLDWHVYDLHKARITARKANVPFEELIA